MKEEKDEGEEWMEMEALKNGGKATKGVKRIYGFMEETIQCRKFHPLKRMEKKI